MQPPRLSPRAPTNPAKVSSGALSTPIGSSLAAPSFAPDAVTAFTQSTPSPNQTAVEWGIIPERMRRESDGADGSVGSSALDAAAATPPRRTSIPTLPPRWGSPERRGSAILPLEDFAALNVLSGLAGIALRSGDGEASGEASGGGGGGGGGGAESDAVSAAGAALDRELAQLGLHPGLGDVEEPAAAPEAAPAVGADEEDAARTPPRGAASRQPQHATPPGRQQLNASSGRTPGRGRGRSSGSSGSSAPHRAWSKRVRSGTPKVSPSPQVSLFYVPLHLHFHASPAHSLTRPP